MSGVLIPYRVSPEYSTRCAIDLALTYALRRPMLALEILSDAMVAAAGRPDLQYRIRDLASVVAS